jgi:hypothetical protein
MVAHPYRSDPIGWRNRRVVRAPVKIAPLRDTLVVAFVLTLGCGPAGSEGFPGFELAPPATWRRVEPSAWMVPGVPLAAWSGPEGSSLVVYRTLPLPGGSAATIAEGLANRLENLPGLQVRERRTETVAGRSAARVEVVAPGTGDVLASSGVGTPVAPAGKSLTPTHQVTLGFVEPDRTLYFTWHIPESSYDRTAPEIQATLDSLRFPTHGRARSSD